MDFMSPGQVVWFEIGTEDADPVQTYYTEIFSWSYELDPDSSVDGRRYIRIIAPGAPFPMGAIQQAPSSPTQMNLSILSADVRAGVGKLAELGAGVQVPATQVSDVTWFAHLTDPAGNPFSLFSRSESERFTERMNKGEKAISDSLFEPKPGSMSGFELGTTDPARTQEFYSAAFGWKFVTAAEGRHDVYTGPQWPSGTLVQTDVLDYMMPTFLVEDVRVVSNKAAELGGTVEAEPGEVASARVRDPRGLRFGLRSMIAR